MLVLLIRARYSAKVRVHERGQVQYVASFLFKWKSIQIVVSLIKCVLITYSVIYKYYTRERFTFNTQFRLKRCITWTDKMLWPGGLSKLKTCVCAFYLFKKMFCNCQVHQFWNWSVERKRERDYNHNPIELPAW